jgi:hypothetical protein
MISDRKNCQKDLEGLRFVVICLYNYEDERVSRHLRELSMRVDSRNRQGARVRRAALSALERELNRAVRTNDHSCLRQANVNTAKEQKAS